MNVCIYYRQPTERFSLPLTRATLQWKSKLTAATPSKVYILYETHSGKTCCSVFVRAKLCVYHTKNILCCVWVLITTNNKHSTVLLTIPPMPPKKLRNPFIMMFQHCKFLPVSPSHDRVARQVEEERLDDVAVCASQEQRGHRPTRQCLSEDRRQVGECATLQSLVRDNLSYCSLSKCCRCPTHFPALSYPYYIQL